jgi:hypothetical protein
MNKWQHFLQQARTPQQHIKDIFTSIMCLDLLQIITWCWEQSSRQGEEGGINNSVEEARSKRKKSRKRQPCLQRCMMMTMIQSQRNNGSLER